MVPHKEPFFLTTLNNTETDLADLNGEVYFLKNTAETGSELWKSNGTVSGTKIVADINAGWGSSGYIYEEKIYTVNDRIVYYANGNGSNNGIYVTDGTAEGTSLLKKTYALFPKKLSIDSTDKIVFTIGNELWVSDAVTSYSLNYTLSNISSFLQYHNKIILNATSGTYVMDENDIITKLTDGNNVVLQAVATSSNGNYVILIESGSTKSKTYIYDGTQLKKTDIFYGGDKNFVETDDRLIFNGYTESDVNGYTIQNNTELFYYKYDGTTGLEKEFFTHGSFYPRFFTPHQNKVFFIATVGSFDQLFSIDNTNKVEQVGNLTKAQSPNNWTDYNPAVTSGNYIYYKGGTVIRSNGTAQGTQQIELAVNETLLEIYPLSDTAVLLKSYNTQHGFMRLWKLNTTSTNPELLAEMPSNFYNSNWYEYKKVGNFIYFKMQNINQTELWKSDGSVANTIKLRDLPSMYFMKVLMQLVDQKLYFIETSINYTENDKLFYLDVNTDESHFVSEELSYFTEGSFVLDEELYFTSSSLDPNVSYLLNKTNGLATGTSGISPLPYSPTKVLKCGNRVFMQSDETSAAKTLYSTDGTTAGTFNIAPGLNYSKMLGCIKNEFYFENENSMYITNGEQGNRTQVNIVGEGETLTASIYDFATVQDRILISHKFGNKGYELFISDIFTSPLATQNVGYRRGNNSIILYPNPTSSEINIKIPGGEKVQKVEFLDVAGRTVANSNEEKINIEKLPAGIYFIKVQTKDKMYSGKVIKK